jgi:hypothetical protein
MPTLLCLPTKENCLLRSASLINLSFSFCGSGFLLTSEAICLNTGFDGKILRDPHLDLSSLRISMSASYIVKDP